jgi:hypothetical protein
MFQLPTILTTLSPYESTVSYIRWTYIKNKEITKVNKNNNASILISPSDKEWPASHASHFTLEPK